jgi:hypothetical protein
VDQRIPGPSLEPDNIDGLTEPTICSLLDSKYNMELAFATVYLGQEVCHTIPIEYGYGVAQPYFCVAQFEANPITYPSW